MPRNYPKPIRALSVEEIALFWSKVQRGSVDECWPWTAGLNTGYGCFSIDSESFGSHRIAKFLVTGINPSDCVLHKCDNRKCCNPNHLFDGTLQDNVVDMVTKGRGASGDGHGSRLHPERLKRGDDHWTRTRPERLARGDRSGSRLHPERLARGDRSGSRLHPERLKRGSDQWKSKLTEDEVREIRSRFAAGQKRDAIADIFGITKYTVWDVVHRTWKHVK